MNTIIERRPKIILFTQENNIPDNDPEMIDPKVLCTWRQPTGNVRAAIVTHLSTFIAWKAACTSFTVDYEDQHIKSVTTVYIDQVQVCLFQPELDRQADSILEFHTSRHLHCIETLKDDIGQHLRMLPVIDPVQVLGTDRQLELENFAKERLQVLTNVKTINPYVSLTGSIINAANIEEVVDWRIPLSDALTVKYSKFPVKHLRKFYDPSSFKIEQVEGGSYTCYTIDNHFETIGGLAAHRNTILEMLKTYEPDVSAKFLATNLEKIERTVAQMFEVF